MMLNTRHMIAEATTSDRVAAIRPYKSGDGDYWPGDNTGEEVHTQSWYNFEKDGGWCHVRRFRNEEFADKFARNIEDIINSGRVGYGSQSLGAGYSCYSLVKAILADNYNYGGNTLDYADWMEDGGKWVKSTGGYWFNWKGMNIKNANFWKLRHDCAIQCTGLGFIAFQMLSGLWFHSVKSCDGTQRVRYLSTQPNYNMQHSFSTLYNFGPLCSTEPTPVVPADYGVTGVSWPCHHKEENTVRASAVYGEEIDGGDVNITVQTICYSLYGNNNETWTPSVLNTEKVTSSGRRVRQTVYRFILCGTAESDGSGGWTYTPAMDHLMSRDGETLEQAFYVTNTDQAIFIDDNPDNVSAPAGTSVSFTVHGGTADDTSLSYQWELSTNGGVSWQNSTASGYNTDTISVTLTNSRDGYMYRCKLTDGEGNVEYSASATMSIGDKLVITENDQDTVSGVTDVAEIKSITTPKNLKRGDVVNTRLRNEGRVTKSGHCVFWI